jgi:hypothetical protein
MWASKTLLCADIKRTRENDDYDRSPRMEEVRGEILRGDRGFGKRLSPWRDSRRGETFTVERLSPWREPRREETFAVERLSPWREPLREEPLREEKVSKES